MVGDLYMRLVKPFLTYPWRLWEVNTEDAAKSEAEIASLRSACPFCLDPGFGAIVQEELSRTGDETALKANISPDTHAHTHTHTHTQSFE